jgi:hypothetical protein
MPRLFMKWEASDTSAHANMLMLPDVLVIIDFLDTLDNRKEVRRITG